MPLYCLLSCVNIRKLSTVVTSVPADVLSACRLGGHHEPCAVLVLAIKISFFKITFSLLIYLTFAFSVLMQTKSSWKAARVSPRSLSTITMFLAGRVGTWAVFVHLGYFIYLLDFSLLQLNDPSLTLLHLEGCMCAWEGLEESLYYFKITTAVLPEHISFWKANRGLPVGAFGSASKIWTGQGG